MILFTYYLEMINIKIQKIALITCWYGYYPWYFPYFIHTCSYNPAIDFILITENKEEIPNRPKNVIIINKSIEEINTSFTDKLGFTVRIENPYKLCDFKPAYGYLFSELINDYDFWGHIDLDIIFGDIREFITEDMLLNYEVISFRHDYTAGYFTLFKNNMKCNMLFKTSRDYIKVFTNAENYWFDECGSLTSKINMADEVLNYPDLLHSMTYVVKLAEKERGLKVFFDFIVIDGLPGNIHWREGKIYYKNMFEAMFYHLIKFKSKCKKQTVLNPIPDEFFITTSNIVRKLY